MRILALLLVVLALAGCGTKGPLYLVGEEGRPRKTESSPGLRPPQ